MASRLRYGRRTARLASLLRSTQSSLRHELEIHGPGNGRVEERIEVLADPTVRELWNGDAARQRPTRGQSVPGRRRSVMAPTGEDCVDGLRRPAARAHIERDAIHRYLGDVDREVGFRDVENRELCGDIVAEVGEHRDDGALK